MDVKKSYLKNECVYNQISLIIIDSRIFSLGVANWPTFIELLLLAGFGEGEAVGDFEAVVLHKPQQHTLHQLRAPNALLLAVLDDL